MHSVSPYMEKIRARGNCFRSFRMCSTGRGAPALLKYRTLEKSYRDRSVCSINADMVGTIGKPVTRSLPIFSRTTCGKVNDRSSTTVAPTLNATSTW